jgi:hypothetical protein
MDTSSANLAIWVEWIVGLIAWIANVSRRRWSADAKLLNEFSVGNVRALGRDVTWEGVLNSLLFCADR